MIPASVLTWGTVELGNPKLPDPRISGQGLPILGPLRVAHKAKPPMMRSASPLGPTVATGEQSLVRGIGDTQSKAYLMIGRSASAGNKQILVQEVPGLDPQLKLQES